MDIVCFSGLLCDSALWQFQQAEFSDRATFHFPDLTQHTEITALAEATLKTLPERFTLMALSMGGYVALEVLRQAPERVEKLILIDTSAREDAEAQKRRRRGLITLAKKGEFKGVTPRLLPMLIHESRLEETKLPTIITDMAQRIGRAGFLNQQEVILSRPDSREMLPYITCPTLVICGKQDQITPLEHHEEIAHLIPNTTLREIDDCGHLSPLERPDLVNEAIESFLF